MSTSPALPAAQRRRRRRERLVATVSLGSLALCLVAAGWAWQQLIDPVGRHAVWLVPGPRLPARGSQMSNHYWRGLVVVADGRSFHLGYVGETLPETALDAGRAVHDWGKGTMVPDMPNSPFANDGLSFANRRDFELPRSISAERFGFTFGDFGPFSAATSVDLPYRPLIVLLGMLPLAWVIRSD